MLGPARTSSSTRPTRRGLGLSRAGLPLHRRRPGARPGDLRGHIADGQLLQAAPDRAALTGSRSGYTWTPAFITYGDNNRTQMLRVPGPGHVEDRSISRAFNPYLAHRRLSRRGPRRHRPAARPRRAEPGQPLQADLGPWPGAASRRSPRACPRPSITSRPTPSSASALGPIADEFLRLKRDEWREYHAQVGVVGDRTVPDGALKKTLW